ncbi:MAG TPA: hypothetical protein DCE24_02570 [Porphyromonadaceae bacterium]|nr:sensor histidine kinase [Paramuribaculum sp.]HAB40720.1 hypothetical protein [Porphyromonadaceae bacterium]
MRFSINSFPRKLLLLLQASGTKLIHFLALCIALLLPELLMNLLDVRNPGVSINLYVKTAVYIVVFYVEYYLVLSGDMVRGRVNWFRFFGLSSIVVVVAMSLLYVLWIENIPDLHSLRDGHGSPPPDFPHLVPGHPETPPSIPYMVGNLVMILLVLALAVAINTSSQLQSLMEKRHESAMLQRELELARIKSQINPHLLFNTLNTIYAMVEINPAEAQKAIHHLSSILRYSLYNITTLVHLEKELEFIEKYCALIKMRLGSRLNLEMDIDAGKMGKTEVAPLMLINAVENAMKYGAVMGEPIKIMFRADAGVLSAEISNSYHPAERARNEGAHIGLRNMRRRLELLYGGRHTIDISDTGSRYVVKCRIDISSPPSYYKSK